MSERRLTTDAEMAMRERLARDDVLPRAYDMMRGAYRADVDRLLSEVVALRQERDGARAACMTNLMAADSWRSMCKNVEGMLEQAEHERDGMRMHLAHIAGIIERLLDSAEVGNQARFALTTVATQARLAAEGGRP